MEPVAKAVRRSSYLDEIEEPPPMWPGVEIPSEAARGVVYRVQHVVGEGAMSVAYYALRAGPEGETPVVVKVLRPWFVRKGGATAELIVTKEAVALGRLNEHVPPTPFVVRLLDAGTYQGELTTGEEVGLPWLALEYVHGGAEGTTLAERVGHSLRDTGFAFDPARAAHAVQCLATGLSAVHDVGVIHRDLKPDNVLCCGFGEDEIFKIADFGVARPAGFSGTFGGTALGTLGYAAPELTAYEQQILGPPSDIFSLAAVVFYLLTGEEYFDVLNPGQALAAMCSTARRSVRDGRWLSPELRASDAACRSIDFALAAATSHALSKRPQRADALAAMVVPWLRDVRPVGAVGGGSALRRDKLREEEELTGVARWAWTTVRGPGSEEAPRVVRSAAWDGDGRCMVATSAGLSFWDGSAWVEVDTRGLPNPEGVRLTRRIGAGRWLVVADDATFATYTPEGLGELRHLGAMHMRFALLSGDLDGLALLVGEAEGEPPTLCTLSDRRWLKPIPLRGVAVVTALARVEATRWLVVGRGKDGRGYVAMVAPLEGEVRSLAVPSVRAFLACAGQHELRMGLAAGAEGAALWLRGGAMVTEQVEAGADVSAVGVDAVGRGWAAGAGKIWRHREAAVGAATGSLQQPGRWSCVWQDESFTAPVVSLFTDLGIVIAMAADGGIIEGRALR
ncbi:serine/threonine-protein kinase [Chondromyces apiculatus]|uniref:Putative serine-threonine protein kinase n=1 Tax=Chondromyces apiculatus DSM 436 TaxID=1192034 RepID=A0A017T6H0_9BACT|nr:serine/threonine-protein kinase [Chondromyces apiculatus]EYF04829.1 putative serine-threonine protein kinase [Chondromyces apiculatus DSM 436]